MVCKYLKIINEFLIILNKTYVTFHFRFIPESARWLLTKGRTKEAKELLQKASFENGVEMPNELLDSLLTNNTNESIPDDRKPSLFDLFRYPNLRRKSTLLFFNWYVCHIQECFSGLTSHNTEFY